MAAFGDIDDPNNYVWVDYTPVRLTAIHLSGVQYMTSTTFPYQLNVTTDPNGGNNFTNVEWTCSNDVNATIDRDTGVIHVIQQGSIQGGEYGVVTCTVTTVWNGETIILTDSMTVYFYQRTLMVGDYVFSDGEYAPTIQEGGGRTAIGRCFYINPENPLDRRMVSMGYISSDQWGFGRGGSAPKIILADGTQIVMNVGGVIDSSLGAALTDLPLSAFAEGHSLSYNYTQVIISLRNTILNGISTPLPVPEVEAQSTGKSVWECLREEIEYAQRLGVSYYYYQAASKCFAYQPTVAVDETLDNRFKAGNWFLPSYAELKQINDYVMTIEAQAWTVMEQNSYYGGNNQNAYAALTFPYVNNTAKETLKNIFAICQF